MFSIPPLACDCHMHVFGPPERYPGAPTRTYTPSLKPFDDYRKIAEPLGLERTVLVQPSAYGADNSAMLDTLGQGSPALRGVVVVDEAITRESLVAMHAAGVRGIRLNLMSPRIADAVTARRLLERAASLVSFLGWHVQIYGDSEILSVVAPILGDLPVPVVFDHMGGGRARLGAGDSGFRAFCALLAKGQCWGKVSGADIVAENDRDIRDALPFLRAMVAANPGRLVWGSDWPHLVHQHGPLGDAAPPAGYRPVSETALLSLLAEAVTSEADWRAILVDNPACLYGFET